MNKWLKLFLKIAFVFGLLFLLVKKGFISVEQTHRALERLDLMVPAFFAIALAAVIGVFRWNILLKAHDIHLPFSRVFQLTFVGNFFNIALPGAVSGDFVKAMYVGKESGLKTKAFGSIVFDRVAGLSALVVLSATTFLIEYASLSATGSTFLKAIQLTISVAAVAVIVFYAYLFLVREKHDPLLIFFRHLGARVPKLILFASVYEALRHYHSHRIAVLKVLLLSLAIHLLVGWVFLQFSLALGVTEIPLLTLYVIVPLGLLVTSIPVMPAGVGTGHAAFLYLFSLLGSQRGADVFSLYALSQITMGAFGGLVYLRFKSHETGPVLSVA
jgi:glycosyltransferase 2 family protein